MQKQNINWFTTVLRVVICFIILSDLTELSVEFCVDEVFKDRGSLDMRRRRRDKSSSLGMPKAPQDNISRSLKHLSLSIPPFLFNNYRLVLVEPKFLLLHMMCAILRMSFCFVFACRFNKILRTESFEIK